MAMHTTMRRIRTREQPAAASTTDDIELNETFTKTLDGQRDFLLFDTNDSDRIIA